MSSARRQFLKYAASIAAAATARGSEEMPARNPRATSSDPVEPKWDERLTLTVGPGKADIVGTGEKALQAAVDSVARWGGGTVRILPGVYKFRNAVYLQSKVRIVGSGAESVLTKEPSISTALSADSDWYDQEITLTDARGFQVGDGICLRAKNPHHGGTDVAKRTLVARSGNRFKLDRALRENFWLPGKPAVSTLFPIFSGEFISDVAIENLTFDGNRANNENLDGNYAGCIFLQDCNRITMRRVEARNYNGDGISWQICHDVVVEDCHSHDHAGLGFHPGSGSQRPLIRRNRSERNDIGLFFCWGVKFGLAENNVLVDNRKHGISIGHRDTDNLIRRNEVRGSGEIGVFFRPERGFAYNAHRNRVEQNTIVDSGKESGVGVDVQGFTDAVRIQNNEIRETRGPMKRVGIRLGADSKTITLAENRIEGFAVPVEDLRKKS
ncbi:MAG: right-handed parallel beta-helix repeat-containing protein [Bryobacteraceae bacterium]